MAEGKPKYVTMFGEGNSPRSWTSTLTESGVIYDVDTNDRVIGGLGMPHSPRIIDGKLYTLLSATGELVQVDIQSSKYISILNAGGFVRGLAYYRDYVFIGLSKLRKNSSSFGKLDIADKSRNAGIVIAHLPTGSIAGQIIYNSSVDEIYDLLVLPNIRRPNILNTSTDDHKLALMTPTSTYEARPRDENGDLNE